MAIFAVANLASLEFAKALRKASPGLKVVIVRDLELKVTSADGRDSTSFLDNAYDMYKQDPKAKNDVIQHLSRAVPEKVYGGQNRLF